MCYNDFGKKVVLYHLGSHTSFYKKKMRLHNVDILEKFLKEIYIAEKDYFEIILKFVNKRICYKKSYNPVNPEFFSEI